MIYESLSTFISKICCFTSYVNTAQGFPEPISLEEEEYYFEKYKKEGDRAARDVLVSHNLKLVAHIVKKFQNSLEADDLISVGTIGLMKAVDTFNYDKGVKFSTYASRCIENEILMLIRSNKRHKDVLSLSSPVSGSTEKDEILLEDIISVEDDDNIIGSVETNFMIEKVFEVMEKHLSPVEQEVIIHRFGLKGNIPLPQREIAKTLGLSRSYISRIENKAMKILQKYMNEN